MPAAMPHIDFAAELRELQQQSLTLRQISIPNPTSYQVTFERVRQLNSNLRRFLRPPVEPSFAEAVLSYIDWCLDFLDQELQKLMGLSQRMGTGDEALPSLGDAAAFNASVYLEFANHYYDAQVRVARLNRPSDQADKEVEQLSMRLRQFRDAALKFFNGIEDLLSAIVTPLDGQAP
jgi:hypothetical protein